VPLETSIPIYADRHAGPQAFGQIAAAIQQSGAVDYFQVWDQLTSWYPQGLWTPENTPLATVMPDCDSFPDMFTMAGYASARAPDLGIVLSTDSCRRGPAEMTQSMLTLADLTGGRAIIQLGAGELKQCKPFGWKRSQGVKRLEDLYRVFDLLMDNDGPVSFEGHHTTLQDAWIGTAKANRPQLWGLGGGPQIIDLATSYADGFCTMCPFVWYSPERFAQERQQVREQLERKGRDPDAFRFGVWATTLLHDDPAVVDRALDNKLTRWLTAIAGRIIMSDWGIEGIEPPMPRDFHYALKMLPVSMELAEVEDWASRATRQMAERSFFYGTPAEAAAQFQPFVDAGVDVVTITDMLAFVLPVEQAQESLVRSIEFSAALKAGAAPADVADIAAR
jgi:phthiodiolone/phenolphthiodiolone dimycocerosates ketoreductase